MPTSKKNPAKKAAAKKKAPVKKVAAKKTAPKKKAAAKKKAAPKKAAPRKKPAGKKNKLGVKNSLVNNINAHKKNGNSKPKKKSSVSKTSYKDMENHWE